ncbi:MAG: hypothetical protein R3C17_15965 [Planctomycetaceae bacterium]
MSSKDPDDVRQQDIAGYIGTTFRGRVSQQFEMYCPRSEEDLSELKSLGFTQVILDRPNLHTAATREGLKVVLGNWWAQDTKAEEIERGIARAREVDPETLTGFSVMDEPDRNTPETPFSFYRDLYEQLKPTFRREFPAARIEISHWGPMASLNSAQFEYYSILYQAADVMRIMPYPDLHEAPLDDVYFIIQRSRKLMKMADRELPLVVILQTWVLPPKNKLPEINELRVMAWQAMLSGAETVSFFDFNQEIWAQTPGFAEGFRSLMKELTGLSRQYRDHTLETTMTANGILKSTLTSSTGHTTRFEINTQRHAVSGLGPLEIKQIDVPSHFNPEFADTVTQPDAMASANRTGHFIQEESLSSMAPHEIQTCLAPCACKLLISSQTQCIRFWRAAHDVRFQKRQNRRATRH